MMVVIFNCSTCEHMKNRRHPHRHCTDFIGTCELSRKYVDALDTCDQWESQRFDGVTTHTKTLEDV